MMNNKWRLCDYHNMKTNESRVNEFARLRIKTNISRRFRDILFQKTDRTCKYTGCTIEELRAHLQSTFTDGMSWENYGSQPDGTMRDVWHIDHIIPCAAFDLQDDFEAKACFHYTNLRAC